MSSINDRNYLLLNDFDNGTMAGNDVTISFDNNYLQLVMDVANESEMMTSKGSLQSSNDITYLQIIETDDSNERTDSYSTTQFSDCTIAVIIIMLINCNNYNNRNNKNNTNNKNLIAIIIL